MAAIILAGGMSSRMGTDKALLEMGSVGLLQSLVTRFAERMGRVIVVLRAGQEVELHQTKTVRDVYQGIGPLGGLHAGLTASSDDENFVLACDMPLADPELALWILSELSDHDAAVPMLSRGPEPLHAAYRKSCLPTVGSSIADGGLRMRDVLTRLDVLYIPEDEIRERDPDLRSFLNINTPEDYREALRIIQTL